MSCAPRERPEQMALVGEAAGGGVERFAADPMLGGERSAGRSDSVGDRCENRPVKRPELLPA